MNNAINKKLYIGLDVGSTTVKAVVMDDNETILWKDYRRHNARQPESVLAFLQEIESAFEGSSMYLFTTGNGGRSLGEYINGLHVQEVNAVTLAVEKLHPRAGSAVELGGQDAKVIIWKKDSRGQKTSISYMNDKCAGGTGATLDKIFSKLQLTREAICDIRAAKELNIHHIAAKCGVFAETDVIGLIKAGVSDEEIVVSLCTAVVKQNIEVLLHGNPLGDDVILLGGPHTYIKAFSDVWRNLLPETWEIHKFRPKDKPMEELVYVPENAQYFAAIGSIIFGKEQEGVHKHSVYTGADRLIEFINEGKSRQLEALGEVLPPLATDENEVAAFAKEYGIPRFIEPEIEKGSIVDVYLGVDGGSTSSKLVIIDTKGELLYKDYVLSKGNPIVDLRVMFQNILDWKKRRGFALNILGTGVTGYASDILQKAFSIDTAVVETVAHLKSAQNYYGDPDVICDVGGQDIKVMTMKHGRVVDIRLNTQCSAGNGYFLQAMADQFEVPVEKYAEHAFLARKAPSFNYGCAVFMEQDKVNFQQLGWTKDEIMAGLAHVLPLNIWNYVVQETNIAKLGTKFILQGGTQKNLAALKAQVDFIKKKVDGAEVYCHKYAEVAGAVGAAIEAKQKVKQSVFVGLKDAVNVSFISKNDDSSRCRFCSNQCPRTFIDIQKEDGIVRYISGYHCEKGMFDNVKSMKEYKLVSDKKRGDTPNLVSKSAEYVFSDFPVKKMPEDILNKDGVKKRKDIVVGIPRLLNMYLYAPFFNAYFRSLGVEKIVLSDVTSQKLWSEGNKFGTIDPCFPAKVAPAHTYNLLKKSEVTHICFPIITHLQSAVENNLGNNACVIQMGTPEVVNAAFSRHINYFNDFNKEYWRPLVKLDRPKEAAGNLFEYFKDRLHLTEEENRFAVNEAYGAMEAYYDTMRYEGKKIINNLVENDRIGILFIGHPYHHDPGLNHGILDEFQLRGYPVLSIESLPVDDDFLGPLFTEIEKVDNEPFDIKSIWNRNFNRNTNLKIWAANVAARHPNLAVIDLSSFKCGHDAPTYSYIEKILDASSTPHFLFHDLDQNKPGATLKIRIESIDYFLKQEEEHLKKRVSQL